MTARTIRSGAHRRILAWLRSGPATVSELAKRFDMRMSHTSLACRQLRTSGLIVRDESGGLRNAPLYLSQKGIDRLRENAVAKLRQYSDHFSVESNACVLQVDDSNVLIGYAERPPGPLIFVPTIPSPSPERSTGNEGGVWVLIAQDSMEWYSMSDFSPTSPPPPSQGTTLQDFSAAPEKVGLVLGSIFESAGDAQLMEGKRFMWGKATPTRSPTRLRAGPVALGTVVGTEHSFFPPNGLLAQLPSSVERSLVLHALSSDALVISDRDATRRRRLPFSVLKPWLEERHPRMSEERREAMWLELTGQIGRDEASLSVALRRELLIDFGEATWTSEGWTADHLDVYGVSVRGLTAVLTSVLDEVRVPFCVDWPFEHVSRELYNRTLVHPSCRLWIQRRGAPPTSSPQNLFLKSTASVSVVNVHSGKKHPLPILLGGKTSTGSPSRPLSPGMPSSASELVSAVRLSEALSNTASFPEGEHGVRLQKALEVFPQGDELLANGYESEDALAAWVASPPEQRAGRWVRLHDRLPSGWVDLLAVEEVPETHLVHAIRNADGPWRTLAFHRLGMELRTRPGLVMDLVDGFSEPSLAPWFAACLLSAVDPRDDEMRNARLQAFDVWSVNPVCPEEVLNNQFRRATLVEDAPHPLLQSCLRLGLTQPVDSLFFVWADGLQRQAEGVPWSPEHQRRVMETLPLSWWASFANDWLAVQLASASGRAWLRDHDLPWMAQLFHTPGWLGGFPGNSVPHPTCSLSSDQLIGVKLMGAGEGVPGLNDLYESLYAFEQGLPPPPCATHPMAGWLVRPGASWPLMDETVLSMGEPLTGRLLYARAYHGLAGGVNPLP